jgi:NAD(P)H-dependent flavin oxidoreductase YrpB (nitropropane dioxygenase family)
VIPVKTADRDAGLSDASTVEQDLRSMIPQSHWDYSEALMERYGVPRLSEQAYRDEHNSNATAGLTAAGVTDQIDAVLAHKHSLLVSALGPPPPDVIDRAHSIGAKVGTLVGRADQAARSAAGGVDLVICQSYEAAAHTGEMGAMVLIPDVVDAVGGLPVLAAGGIGSGRQMAAAMALGAQGVWTGSIWLTTQEANTEPDMVQRMLGMSARDTVRSKAQTGKPNRQMRTPWTEAWDDPAGPGTLPMPLQYILFAEYTARARRAGVTELVGMPVGQVVGRMTKVRPAAEVVHSLAEEYIETIAKMTAQVTDYT